MVNAWQITMRKWAKLSEMEKETHKRRKIEKVFSLNICENIYTLWIPQLSALHNLIISLNLIPTRELLSTKSTNSALLFVGVWRVALIADFLNTLSRPQSPFDLIIWTPQTERSPFFYKLQNLSAEITKFTLYTCQHVFPLPKIMLTLILRKNVGVGSSAITLRELKLRHILRPKWKCIVLMIRILSHLSHRRERLPLLKLLYVNFPCLREKNLEISVKIYMQKSLLLLKIPVDWSPPSSAEKEKSKVKFGRCRCGGVRRGRV